MSHFHFSALNGARSYPLHGTMRSISYFAVFTASLASAARFIIHIPTTPLVNPATLPPTTHATIQASGPPQSARLSKANSFTFTNVSAGSYLATIHCRDYAFEPLRIDVAIEDATEGSGDKREVVKAWQTFIGNEWDNKGESRGEGGNGLVIEARPLGLKEYYERREGCEYPLLRPR